MSNVFRVHPKNSRIFEYNNRPIVLLCATEHYGAVMNRPFDYEAYLKYCYEYGQNYTRLFMLFRELQTPVNPHSTCKPESTDYISPYERTGPGNSADGLPRYDLDRWNPEFFRRLHDFMETASKYDVIVEVTLFSNSYTNDLFSLIPFGKNANINDVGCESFQTFMTKKEKVVFERQLQYVEKVVRELNQYENFFFEICNEPVSFNKENASVNEINEWQQSLIGHIRKLEEKMPNKHLIAITDCWEINQNGVLEAGTDKAFGEITADIVNVHPLDNIIYRGKAHDLGLFMSKRLCLSELREFCLEASEEEKPLNIDEDNIASRFMDYEGWTIHRKRAWTAILSGAHYDYIDFSIGIHCPTGTVESKKFLHKWYRNLRGFLEEMEIVAGRPLTDMVLDCPEEVLCSAFGNPGVQYNIYIADKRELGEEGCGGIIAGGISVSVIEGKYEIMFISPEEGNILSTGTLNTGEYRIILPDFRHDIAVRLTRV